MSAASIGPIARASEPAERKSPRFLPWVLSVAYSDTRELKEGVVKPTLRERNAAPMKNTV